MPDHDTTPPMAGISTRAPLGVLFVHGIGGQKRGDTLLGFGEPIYNWIRDHNQPPSGAKEPTPNEGRTFSASVSHSTLRDDQGAPTTPAHAVVEIGQPSSPRTWILAESHWSETFQPPSAAQLAAWLFLVGPWTLDKHFSRALLRSLTDIRKAGARAADDHSRTSLAKRALAVTLRATNECVHLCWLFFVWLTAIFAQLAIPALLLLVAFPPTRPIAIYLQQALAGSLGDSFGLLKSEFRFAAMRCRVQRDFEWLRRGCDKVVVIAHSQGAVVARAALRSSDANPALLITVGAGIHKLDQLREALSKDYFRRVAPIRLIGSASLLSSLPFLGTVDGWTALVPWVLSALGVGAIATCAYLASPDACGKNAHDDISRDDYAARDPVPNGSLIDNGTKVSNLHSQGEDHTSYWRNRDEFVSSIVRDLCSAEAGETDAICPSEQEVERASESRNYRATWRQWSLGFAPATALVTLFAVATFHTLAPQARTFATRLKDLKIPDWLNTVLDILPFTRDVVVLAILSLLVVSVYEALTLLVWTSWDGWAMKKFHEKVAGFPPYRSHHSLYRYGLFIPHLAPWVAFAAAAGLELTTGLEPPKGPSSFAIPILVVSVARIVAYLLREWTLRVQLKALFEPTSS